MTAAGSPEKRSYLLVSFRHGDPAAPVFERYTDEAQDVEGFVSTPSMGVELPENNAGFEDKEAKLEMPLDAFTEDVSCGLPWSPIFVQIEEVTAGTFPGDAGSRTILFKGRITRTIKNFEGHNDSVAFFALPAKARLDVPMGIQCNHHCFWQLFGRGCGLNALTFAIYGQIAAMDGKEITITPGTGIETPTSPGGNVDRYWERGYLEKDGLKIGVHIWVLTDPLVFVLRRRPPNSWLLAGATSVRFVPGCHKTIEDCRDVWDNEEHIMNAGYAMPAYHPQYQSPQ